MAVGGLVISAFVIGFVAFFSGYAVGRYEVGPFKTAQRAEYKLFGQRFERAGNAADVAEWGASTDKLTSIFFDLETDIGRAPINREGAGGGLTSFGDDVLLLTHEGRIFVARSGDEIVETKIQTPDNGFGAYAAAAADHFSEYRHDFAKFRYNDILYFQSGERRGLAISYTEWRDDEQCYGNTVAVLPVEPSAAAEEIVVGAEDWDIVFRTDPCLPLKKEYRAIEGHVAGGRMVFRAPASLILTSGDYHWDGVYAPEAIAQDLNKDYGKVIEIDLVSAAARALSHGHRNIQGIAFDSEGGLWAVEHGMRGGDELNRIVAGTNYGWPEATLGTQYSGLPFPNTHAYGRHDIHTAPVFAWLPSAAPSGLTLVENFHDSWDGDLLMSGLSSQSLFRIRISDGNVLFTEQIHVGRRVRYIHQHNDGRLVLWTDDGYLVFLQPAQLDATAQRIERYIRNASLDDGRKTQLKTAVDGCMLCHSFRSDVHAAAPGLGAIGEKPFASTAFENYSPALANADGSWDFETLSAFIDAPDAVAPGTIMSDPGIDDPLVRDELAKMLIWLKNDNE